jgi:hypothetical protein
MIDFTKVKRRVKKHTVEEGDFYLRDISSKEGKDIAKKAGKKVDLQVAAFLRSMMCDEKGELLNYTDDQLSEIPVSLMQDVVAAVTALVYGEKKS